MKRHTWGLSRWLSALLFLCAWMAALCFAQQCGPLTQGAAVRWTGAGAGVSPADLCQAERWAAEDGSTSFPDLVLWQEQENQMLTDQTGERSTPVRLLTVFGQADLLWPGAFLRGGWPIRGDIQGIALDEAAAAALWGSTDVLGETVEWNGNTYTVRGVFQGDDGLALIQTEESSTQAMDRAILQFQDGGGGTETTAWLSQNGFPVGQVTDLPLLGWVLNSLAALPGLALGVVLLLRLGERLWRLRRSPLLLSQCLIPVLAAGGLTLWVLGFPWKIPDRLIPTRWSDFDFWTALAGELTEELWTAVSGAMGARDGLLWPAALGCLVWALAACALLAPAGRLRPETGTGLLLACLGAAGSVFVLTLLFARLGGGAPGRTWWLLPPLWLASDYGLRRHDAWLTADITPPGPALTAGEEERL